MTDPNFSAIRARLRYESLDDFIDGYSRFISNGGMFIPMAPSKLKPVGTTIRFQFLLQDGATAMLGEGVVRQIQGADSDDNSPVGMLVKFTKLSRDSKGVVERIIARKSDDAPSELAPDSEQLESPAPGPPPQGASGEDAFDDDPPELSDADDAQTRDADDEPSAPESTDGEQDRDEQGAPRMNVAASGNDVFSEAEVESEPAAATPEERAPSEASGSGPRELGRTEAGLQIMAFDEASDDDMAGFGDFEFDGDEDDVDQMFDGIFGGGGGGGDGAGLFGGGDEEPLIADGVNDGGTPVEAEDDADDAADEPDDAAAQTYDLDDDVNETFDLDEDLELSEESSPDAPEEEPVDQTYDLEEEVDLDDESSLGDEVILEKESAPAAEEDVEEDIEEDVDLDPPMAIGLGEETSGPSEDVMSALGSLKSDAEDVEQDYTLSIGAGPDEPEEVAEDDDDEESLESLLALAQQDISAKRETEDEDEDQGDILDSLLGSDDLPPPPGNEPVFDLGDGENKKKKKGGFISKLFGKD